MPATVNPDPDPEDPFQSKDESTKTPPPRADSQILRSLKETPMTLYTRFCRNHKWCFGIVVLIAVVAAIIGVHFCGWNGDACIDKHEEVVANFTSTYPDCFVSNSSKVGDGHCDDGEYNTVMCLWDGGDCVESNKLDPPPGWPGNSSIIASYVHEVSSKFSSHFTDFDTEDNSAQPRAGGGD